MDFLIINESRMRDISSTLNNLESYLRGASMRLGELYHGNEFKRIISGVGGKSKYKKVLDGFNKKYGNSVRFSEEPGGVYCVEIFD